MDGSVLQPVGLIAVAVAMVLTLFEMRSSLRPATCPRCTHCAAIAEEEARIHDQLARDHARRVGLDDDEDDHRRIG